MKTWKIPVTWSVCGEIMCEADTLEEAMIRVRDDEMPLPSEFEYVDGSFEPTFDLGEIDLVRDVYNNSQEDEHGREFGLIDRKYVLNQIDLAIEECSHEEKEYFKRFRDFICDMPVAEESKIELTSLMR